MEKNDLVLWTPLNFVSEDGIYQTQDYSIPRLRFRSGEISPKKPDGVFRIVVMGGSNVWGDGVADPSLVFPTVLQEKLNSRSGPVRYEVVNAGVKGYSSLQVLVLLERFVVNYEPDMAVFYILRNDLVMNWGPYTLREIYERGNDARLRAVLATQRLFARSRLYNGLARAITDVRGRVSRRYGMRMGLRPAKTDDDFSKNLADIARVCREHRIRPVFVAEYQSADQALGYEYRRTDLERRLEETAKKFDAPYLDANRHFYTEGDWRVMTLPDDKVHLSAEGHRIMADYLGDFLVRSKLLWTVNASR